MAIFKITKSIANDTLNGVLGPFSLDAQVRADATIAASTEPFVGMTHFDGSDDLIFNFDGEPSQAVKDALDAVLAAHNGTEPANLKFILSVALCPGSKSVENDAAWDLIGGSVSQLEGAFGDLAGLMGALGFSYKCTEGAGSEKPSIRCCEHLSGNPDPKELANYELADTGGLWVNLQLPTTDTPRAGLNSYLVEATRNSATLFELRFVVLTLFRVLQ